MYPEDLEAWLRATQPQKWDRLQAMNGDKTLTVVMDRLETALEKQGNGTDPAPGLLGHGAGHIDLSEAAPEDQRNEKVLHRYASRAPAAGRAAAEISPGPRARHGPRAVPERPAAGDD